MEFFEDPANNQYANETYLQSLGASSRDVRRQIQNALAEITRQRQVAQQNVARIPEVTGSAYQGGRNALDTDLRALGLGGASGADDRFFTRSADAYRRAAELLNHGFQEQAAQRSGATQQLQQSLLAEIAGKANDYVGRRFQEDTNRWFQQEEARRQNLLQQNLQDQQARMQAQALTEQARQADLNRQHQRTLTQMMYPSPYAGPAATRGTPTNRPLRPMKGPF